MLEPRVLAKGFSATECPRWHAGRLYFSDMHGKAVYVMRDGGPEKLIDVPGTPAGLGWLPDDSLLVVAQEERTVYRLKDGELTRYADLSSVVDSALNDMWVLPDGTAYVGEMGFDVHAFLAAQADGRQDGPAFAFARVFFVDTDGSFRSAGDTEFMFPNGIVSGPRSDELLVAESFGLRISAFDIGTDGSLINRRLWAQLDFAPDGISLDGDGHLWVADPAGKRAALVAEGGAVLESVTTQNACLSVALSQHDLYLCTTASTEPRQAVELASSQVETVAVTVGRFRQED